MLELVTAIPETATPKVSIDESTNQHHTTFVSDQFASRLAKFDQSPSSSSNDSTNQNAKSQKNHQSEFRSLLDLKNQQSTTQKMVHANNTRIRLVAPKRSYCNGLRNGVPARSFSETIVIDSYVEDV